MEYYGRFIILMLSAGAGVVVVAGLVGTAAWYWGSGGTEPKPILFGIPLEEIDEDNMVNDVPRPLDDCFNELEKHISEEGLLRVSGESAKADELITLYENNETPDLSGINPHTISTFMKKFFNKMPEPLLTFALYEDWIAIQDDTECTDSLWKERVSKMIFSLPSRNRATFLRLLQFLGQCHENQDANRMTASNLGTVVAPSICYPAPDYPTSKMMTEISKVGSLISRMIPLSDDISSQVAKLEEN